MATMQDVMDRARADLNDNHATDAKRRTPDAKLLLFANDGVREAISIRPDLWLSSYSTPYADLAAGGTFPFDDYLVHAVANYCVFRAERKDDQHVLNERSKTAYQLFLAGLGVI